MNYRSFVETHLKIKNRAGNEWQCLCPFHDERDASFSINVQRGLFICYACGEKGAFPKLVEHITGERSDFVVTTSTADLRRKLKDLDAPEEPEPELDPAWIDYWKLGRERWADRSITSEAVLDAFDLGYSIEDDALMIPLHDRWGTPLGAVRRFFEPVEGQPKYKYPRGLKISELLYGFHQAAKVDGLTQLAVTEGSIDTLTLWQHDIPSVALLGARCSAAQLKLLEALSPVELLILTDNDAAGRACKAQLKELLVGTGILTSSPGYWPRECKDIGDMTSQQVYAVAASASRF